MMCVPVKCEDCDFCKDETCLHDGWECDYYRKVDPKERHIKCPIVDQIVNYNGKRECDVTLYDKYRECEPTLTTSENDDEQWIYQEICNELSDTDEVTIFSPIYEPCP